MCVQAYICMCVDAYTHVEARAAHVVSFSVTFSLIALTQNLTEQEAALVLAWLFAFSMLGLWTWTVTPTFLLKIWGV